MPADAYYLARDGTTTGPHQLAELLAWRRSGRLRDHDLLWSDQRSAWLPVPEFPELSDSAALPPAAVAAPTEPAGPPPAGARPTAGIACDRHPAAAAIGACAGCGQLLCDRCLHYLHEQFYCAECREQARGKVIAEDAENLYETVAGAVRRRPLIGVGLVLLLFYAANYLFLQRRWQYLPEFTQQKTARLFEQFQRVSAIAYEAPEHLAPDRALAWQRQALAVGARIQADTTVPEYCSLGVTIASLQLALEREDTATLAALAPKLAPKRGPRERYAPWETVIESVFFTACARYLGRGDYPAAAAELESLLTDGEFFFTAQVQAAWHNDRARQFGIPPTLVVTPAQVCYYLGDCLWRGGRKDQARQVWSQLPTTDPTAERWLSRCAARMRE